MQYKSKTFQFLQEYIAISTNQGYGKIQQIKTDCGTEFLNQQLQQYLSRKGIHHEPAAPRNPEYNSVVKRANRILYEKTHEMLAHSYLPNWLWPYAVYAASYLKNISFIIPLNQ